MKNKEVLLGDWIRHVFISGVFEVFEAYLISENKIRL